MKNAAFNLLNTPLNTPLTSAQLLVGAAPSSWAETQPACWRSEAFAEDLADLLPAARTVSAPAPTGAARPLLRRALAAVFGR